MRQKRFDRSAFTLIELLVVIFIIGILVGLVLPAVQAVRETARRTQCSNNIRQCALGILDFESARKFLPSGIKGPTSIPYRSMSWLTQILPYIERQNMWDNARSDYELDPIPYLTHANMRTPVETFQCPSDPATSHAQITHGFRLVALTDYLGVNGTNYQMKDGVFFKDSAIRLGEILDGQSNTLMIGERPPSPDFWYGWWYAGYGQDASGSPDMLLGTRERNDGATYLEMCPPGPYHFEKGINMDPANTLHYWSYHSGGANFCLADGSVHFIPYFADDIMDKLATRAGFENFTPPW